MNAVGNPRDNHTLRLVASSKTSFLGARRRLSDPTSQSHVKITIGVKWLPLTTCSTNSFLFLDPRQDYAFLYLQNQINMARM